MRLIYILTTLTTNWVCLFGNGIKLFPFRQEDSDTHCTHGLVSDVDTVVFKAVVDYSKDDNFPSVYFQRKLKNDSEFTFFKGIVLNESDTAFDGLDVIRPQVALITIKEKARTGYSGASIRGVIISSDYKEMISDEQTYPAIGELTETKGQLLINGVETTLETSSCVISATGPNIVIQFQCDSKVLPCLIEISATDLTTPLRGQGFVTHTSRLSELNITIKYGPCSLNGTVHLSICYIKLDSNSTTGESNPQRQINVIYVFIAIFLTLIMVVILVVILRESICKDLLKKSRLKGFVYTPSYTFQKQETPLDDEAHLVPERVKTDIHTNYVWCKQNLGDNRLIPVTDCNINNVLKAGGDNNLVEFVKSLADLTVQVGVKMTSTGRPECWPNTYVPDLFYNMRGTDVIRVGTGIILFIHQIRKELQMSCTCHKGHHDHTPGKVYFNIYMKTSPRIVFDDLEARHTTARLFHDRRDCPMVTLEGWRVVDSDGDTCLLKCETCDVVLADKIFTMTEHLWDAYENIKANHTLKML